MPSADLFLLLRATLASSLIKKSKPVSCRILDPCTIADHCSHIIEPLGYLQIDHFLIEVQCLLRIFFYPSGPPRAIKIRQIMHRLPMPTLNCLTV
ncbi:hypothetical protein AOU28_22355 [Pseudomonas aeruginosa]|nr:hypothetical protein AOU28_22355 [Pseudomonas aeruginosa]